MIQLTRERKLGVSRPASYVPSQDAEVWFMRKNGAGALLMFVNFLGENPQHAFTSNDPGVDITTLR